MTTFVEKAQRYIDCLNEADDDAKLDMIQRGAATMAAAAAARQIADEANRDPSKPRPPVVNFVSDSQHPLVLAMGPVVRRLAGLSENAEFRLTQSLVEFNATLRMAADPRSQKDIPSATLLWPGEPGQPAPQALAVVAIYDLANTVPPSAEGLLFVLEDGSKQGFMLDGSVIDEPICGERLLPLACRLALA